MFDVELIQSGADVNSITGAESLRTESPGSKTPVFHKLFAKLRRISQRRNTHWALSALFLIGLVSGFHQLRLPFNVNWERMFSAYWGGLAVRAMFCTVLLYVIGFPLDRTVKPLWHRYLSQKPRFLVLVLFSAAMLWEFGPALGVVVVVDGIALAELFDRCQDDLDSILGFIKSLMPASAYLFFGLVMMFAYNDLIASSKFLGAYDQLFLKLDSYFLHRSTVSEIAHRILSHLSASELSAIEFIYYGMFGQIGAALILVAGFSGRKEALRYVGTILTAYYLALIIFYLCPSMGPFYSCPHHFANFPRSLATYNIQQSAILKFRLLASPYRSLNQVDTDYFIAFPCMHVAQPLIVLWFLRGWKRIAIALVIYDVLLVPAILLLEWHYLVDLAGGIVVTAVSITLTGDNILDFRRKPSSDLTARFAY